MKKVSAYIEADVFEKLSLESTLAAKSSFGGTSPERVAEALEKERCFKVTPASCRRYARKEWKKLS